MSEQNKQIEQEKISLVAKLAGKQVGLDLRMISMAEETALRQRYAALADSDDKAQKEYEINVDALDQFALGEIREIGKEDVAPWHVKDYFRERTAFKERVAEYAIRAFLQKLVPDISFL